MRRLAAVAALLSLVGCSYSMVSGGRLRENAFESVLDRSVAARGIPLDVPVDARVVSQAELTRVLDDALSGAYAEGELEDYERALVTVGLWPPDLRLRDVYIDVMSQEAVGLYVPADAALYVVTDAPRPWLLRILSSLVRRDLVMELALAHEIVHLLQHRRYPDLLDAEAALDDQDDLASAIQAALEGDATRYGFEALGIPAASMPPATFRDEVNAELAREQGALGDAPALIRLTLGFPYTEGYAMSFAEGTRLLEDPPASTEQVMHPERRHEAFTVLDLDDSALPEGCRLVHENTVGELYVSVLFRELGEVIDGDVASEVSEDVASEVSEGWDGDRYLVAECSSGFELVWLTLWDSVEDAAQFEDAYTAIGDRVSARAGFASAPRVAREGTQVLTVSDGLGEAADRIVGNARRARVRGRSDIHEFAAE